ncbi:MAG: SPOR domain-containing protein, partial [Calditrichaeota bacterium]
AYPIQPKEGEKATGQAAKSTQASPTDTSAAKTMLGYRVQILQTEDAEEARMVQKDAILALDADVYLIYDNPYYKVRVGDFASRYEAETFLEKVVKKGYSSAWIVRTRINTTPTKQDKEQP